MTDDVQINFTANAQQTLAQLQAINKQLTTMNTNLETAGTKGAQSHGKQENALNKLAGRFIGLNMAVNQAINLQHKIVEYVQSSVAAFREFETRIAEVNTILDRDSRDAIDGLQAGVESLSLAFGKGTSDMAKGLYDIISAAFDAQQAIALLGTASKASIAGITSIRTAVDVFADVLNTYGMSAYEATRVSDVLFQSVIRGKFEFTNLKSAIGYVLPIAAQAGIEFEELMAVLSTATRHGLHLDMAARGLALTIQNIINPSNDAAEAAKKYGIQLNALSLRTKGLKGFFEELNQKTKIYGTSILNEIVPNMRSLRVAMILAGDEGVKGLADDLDYLTAAGGRTNEALLTMMDTSTFISNQITQEWEKTQREVGEAWDGMIMGGQRFITWLADNWTMIIPVYGGLRGVQKQMMEGELWEYQDKIMRNLQPPDSENDLAVMKDYLSIQQRISSLSASVGDKKAKGENYEQDYAKLLFLQDLSTKLQDGFNAAFGEPILGGIRKLGELDALLVEIEVDAKRIIDELSTPITVGWGDSLRQIGGTLNLTLQQKEAEQERVDTMYDIDQAMRDSNYTWKTNNQAVKDAVSVMRDYEDAQEAAKKATSELNREMVRLQIEALKIEIMGMSRRRGLTRSEEKRLKQIQIEQAKLRLEGMKAEYEATDITENTYNEKKEFLDDYVADLKHEEYVLKYTLDSEIEALNLTILSEKDLLAERAQAWMDTKAKILTSAWDIYNGLEAIKSSPGLVGYFDDIGIDILGMFKEAKGYLETQIGSSADTGSGFQGIFGAMTPELLMQLAQHPQGGDTGMSLWDYYEYANQLGLNGEKKSYSRGIQYVPETQVAMVHRGESIVPSGQNFGKGMTIGTLTIQVQTISDIDSPERLGRVLAETTDRGIIQKGEVRARNKNTGNSYRVI
jgi:TP901 family phage tail tape measure protein